MVWGFLSFGEEGQEVSMKMNDHLKLHYKRWRYREEERRRSRSLIYHNVAFLGSSWLLRKPINHTKELGASDSTES
jgi:hypothetical protein